MGSKRTKPPQGAAGNRGLTDRKQFGKVQPATQRDGPRRGRCKARKAIARRRAKADQRRRLFLEQQHTGKCGPLGGAACEAKPFTRLQT